MSTHGLIATCKNCDKRIAFEDDVWVHDDTCAIRCSEDAGRFITRISKDVAEPELTELAS